MAATPTPVPTPPPLAIGTPQPGDAAVVSQLIAKYQHLLPSQGLDGTSERQQAPGRRSAPLRGALPTARGYAR